MTVLLLVSGFALLIVGAEGLVRGASRLAGAAGISPLVIGLTVVAYGTSAPELAISLLSAVRGSADLAVGNVVGSNIFNVLFILGLAALIAPLVVKQQIVRLDVPVMIVVSLVVWALAGDGGIGRLEGLLLVAGAVAYTVFLIRGSRRETKEVREEYDREFGAAARPSGRRIGKDVLIALVGLVLLVAGAQALVTAAVDVARRLGVSELVIGLTIVAAGTSLPEVATSVLATIRGERDIAVGNIVGSNIFNLLTVLGGTAALSPAGVAVSGAALRFDIPVMVAVSVACLPIVFTGSRISRWEGALFFGYWLAYTAFVVLAATRHEALDALRTGLVWFALPLTTVTLAVVSVRAVVERRRR